MAAADAPPKLAFSIDFELQITDFRILPGSQIQDPPPKLAFLIDFQLKIIDFGIVPGSAIQDPPQKLAKFAYKKTGGGDRIA